LIAKLIRKAIKVSLSSVPLDWSWILRAVAEVEAEAEAEAELSPDMKDRSFAIFRISEYLWNAIANWQDHF
jgi:hypothetical protein